MLEFAAGAGSYVSADRDATRVDVTSHLHSLVGAFDAAVWAFPAAEHDPERVLPEVRRVTSGPIVVLTRDPARAQASWLADYAPEVVAAEAQRSPSLDRITAALPDDVVTTSPLPIRSRVSAASPRRTTAGRSGCSTQASGARTRRGRRSTR